MLVNNHSIFTLPTDIVVHYLVEHPDELNRLTIRNDNQRYKLWLHVNLDLAGRLVNGHGSPPKDGKAERVFNKSPILVYHCLLKDPLLLNSWRFGVFAKTMITNSRIATLAVEALLRQRCGRPSLPLEDERCNWCLNCRDAKLNPEFYCCGGCRKVQYCGKSCQQKHWSFHMHECNPTKKCPATADKEQGLPSTDPLDKYGAFDIDDELTACDSDVYVEIVFGDE